MSLEDQYDAWVRGLMGGGKYAATPKQAEDANDAVQQMQAQLDALTEAQKRQTAAGSALNAVQKAGAATAESVRRMSSELTKSLKQDGLLGGTVAAPSPAPLAIPALTESRCGTLVRIDGVRYTPEDLSAATWAGSKRFTDADGSAVYTYVRRYARFADAEVPAGTVSLTGILQYDAAGDGRYILKLRDENDCTH